MNREAVKEVLRSLAQGIYLLGTGRGPSAHLVTVSWATQVSREPPMLAVALHRETRALDHTLAEMGFTLSPLAEPERSLASRLGRPAPGEDRLQGVEVEWSPTLGLPLPVRATGWLECRVTGSMEVGDHLLVAGTVVDAGVRSDAPTLLLRETGWRY